MCKSKKKNDTIYDQHITCFARRDHIFEEMGRLKFKSSKIHSIKTNSQKQAYELYKIYHVSFAGLTGEDSRV